ncbi:MAG: universal stress protein [Candidatus Sericytochromatia bacterium]|nr:universal stress protein [Candidatus Tanganyikabacteria bacterium]
MAVATDFSIGSALAVGRAARLPLGPGAEILLVHVVAPGARTEELSAARFALDLATFGAAAVLRAVDRADLLVRGQVAQGEPDQGIDEMAGRERADLVVIGRRGARGLREILLGSTAERVVRFGHTPVLVVNAVPEKVYHRPLVAVDPEEDGAPLVVSLARLLAPEVGTLDVVHSFSVLPVGMLLRAGASEREILRYEKDAIAQARSKVQAAIGDLNLPLRLRFHLRRGDPQGTIQVESRRLRADVIAVGTAARIGTERWIFGSVAEGVIAQAHTDVLVVRRT